MKKQSRVMCQDLRGGQGPRDGALQVRETAEREPAWEMRRGQLVLALTWRGRKKGLLVMRHHAGRARLRLCTRFVLVATRSHKGFPWGNTVILL